MWKHIVQEEQPQPQTTQESDHKAAASHFPVEPNSISHLIHKKDVSEFLNRKWEGCREPTTPIEKLILMGFANRELNNRLLEKHHHNLPAVINELLDTDGMGYQPV